MTKTNTEMMKSSARGDRVGPARVRGATGASVSRDSRATGADAQRSPALSSALARLEAAPDDFLDWVGKGEPWPGDGPERLGKD